MQKRFCRRFRGRYDKIATPLRFERNGVVLFRNIKKVSKSVVCTFWVVLHSGVGGWGAGVSWEAAHKRERRC